MPAERATNPASAASSVPSAEMARVSSVPLAILRRNAALRSGGKNRATNSSM